ncbi:MAG: AAA family ATPase [Ideonella sp.]|nr:AAA family ATPase [Ideonella sp.]
MQGTFVVGNLNSQSTAVYIVEGVGQGWACSNTTGHASVVAFGSNRDKFVSIIRDLQRLYPKSLPVLVADRGKEDLAEDVARATNINFICMPNDWPSNSDVNDLWKKDGDDALKALLSSPRTLPLRYKLLSGNDLLALPSPRWCVRDVLPATGIAAMFGPSGAGKSFLILDLAAAIAEGTAWCGRSVRKTPVVYVALEGQSGFQLRARAWVKHNQRSLPDGVRFVLQAFDLTNGSDVSDLVQSVNTASRQSVVVLDTLNAAAPTIDENASAGMGVVLQAAKDLQLRCDGLVLLVHHSGKEVARGLRGHSSLVAALDASIEVTRESDARQWRLAKAKDSADGLSGRFELKPIDLGPDDEGEPWSSCAVVHAGTVGTSPPRLQLGGGTHQRVALDVLRPMFREAMDSGMASAPPGRACIELKAAIAAVGPRLVCDVGRRTERAGQAITGLVGKGALAHDSGWLWLP